MYKEGIPDLKKQVEKWSGEAKEKLLMDPQIDMNPRKIILIET